MCEGDIDYCMSDPCQNGATCHDQQTDYRCACVPGFTGINCETEVDECDPNPCLNGGTCEVQCVLGVRGGGGTYT